MFAAFRAWRRRRTLNRLSLEPALWQRVAGKFGFINRLAADDVRRLKAHCMLFIHEKQFSGAGGLQLDQEMKLGIAVQACILILNLGLDYYDDWVEIIVYPDEFLPRQEYRNEHGLVQRDESAYSGQAWLKGPVILSWASVANAWHGEGANVVIHEFSHKLDMLNGDANGFPPLHAGMSRQQWSKAFSAAYRDLCWRVESGMQTELDAYACESPGEFFAVMSEMFFELPEVLARNYPDVYGQLARFYRQDPLSRESLERTTGVA